MRLVLRLILVLACLVPRLSAQAGGPAFLVRDINADASSSPSNLTAVKEQLFFVADDSEHGRELWMSNGTAGGTTLVKDINLGAGNAFVASNSYPEAFANQLTGSGGRLFFVADDGQHGRELWMSDGTAGGTTLVKDINLGAGDAAPIYLTPIGGRLFFVADDGHTGAELWVSDGTADGTRKVKDIRADADPFISSLTVVGGTLFFAANMATELWRSDGTVTGTLSLGDFSYVANLIAMGDVLFFEAENSACPVHGLWKSDGTSTGTKLIACVDGLFREARAVGDTYFFFIDDPAFESGYELWRSDGTLGGTVRVGDQVYPLPPDNLTEVNGWLFFSACVERAPPADPRLICALWKSDGTAAGTLAVEDGFFAWLTDLASVSGMVIFDAGMPSTGYELWRSDGTVAGTSLVHDIAAGPESSSPAEMMVAGSYVFFSAATGAEGRELWAIRLASLRQMVVYLPLVGR